ncbi:MAG: hypothetical protein MHM6MM_008599 [Cercozoa sp. M6MM]
MSNQQVFEMLLQLSEALDTGLNREQLAAVSALCAQGVSAEAVAAVIVQLREETARLAASRRM